MMKKGLEEKIPTHILHVKFEFWDFLGTVYTFLYSIHTFPTLLS